MSSQEKMIPAGENKMGTMPVFKLIMNMSLPMMFSMFIQSMYNIVDSFFVAKISENAITAVSLAFPIQNLMISFAVGTSIGVNALLSTRLGQKNQNDVNKAATNGLFLAFATYAVFAVLGIFTIKPYFYSQIDIQEIRDFGITYLNIVLFVSFGMFGSIMMEKLLQSTGKATLSMWSQLAGALTNIILDPILIMGLGPIPAMGIAGAAWATVAGQILALTVGFTLNVRKNREIQFKLKGFRPEGKIIWSIYKVGIPSIVLSSIASVTTTLINMILGAFSSTAIAVYGLYFKLNSFVFMPVFGLNSGIVPIIAYNYGAQNYKRLTSAIKLGLAIAFTIMFVGMLIFLFFPAQLLGLFEASGEMLAIGIPAMRIIASSFCGAAIAIVLGSVFQALSMAMLSMAVSVCRQVLVLLPCAYLLSLTGNINRIWLCFPIAEVVSVGLSLVFMAKVYKDRIKPLKNLKKN
ncbi:MAG: MATE family efflux transporter [Treponemataceae bacterium]|nr:MATE family efflux transporter [Treponemataceae bacterium]